jgi:predicted phosphodiesterase
MNYQFFHISDLHYRDNWQEEMGLVCQRFIEDIKNQTSTPENSYLIFSGDLVRAGEDPALYSTFISKFGQELTNAGFPRERRICIPGNHDVSQASLKPILQILQGALAGLKDERSFNDNLPVLTESFLVNGFTNYKNCESEFASYNCCGSMLGGNGWALSEEVGVYCLNTALCSFAGLKDSEGKAISDQNRLMLDTRSLYKWIQESKCKIRILVMHHPLYWLAEWARTELEKIIATSFDLVFSGHIHANSATYASKGIRQVLHCIAPPLFTKKDDLLGYSFVRLDSETKAMEVVYRQWSPTHSFVAGTSLAGNDTGKLSFYPTDILSDIAVEPHSSNGATLEILQAEFDEARTCYSSKRQLWVDRDLASVSETDANREGILILTQNDLVKQFRDCIIRAPKQYGLTSLGRFMALEYQRQNTSGGTVAMVDVSLMPHHKQGVIQYMNARCAELKITKASLRCIILDNWHSEKFTRRVLRELKSEYVNVPLVLLHGVDDCTEIANVMEMEEEEKVETLYLWALTRNRIRELVGSYVETIDFLDANLVTKKVIADIDALNIHRTPLNCLLILKLAEQAFDDSPVNRTEMIGRVLYLLFFQFNKIPRYATRPDLKDCEYALGYFAEWLIRSGKQSFTKSAFYSKVEEYCSGQMLDLDIEVLFSFLATENLFVRKGIEFEFRFNYWLYFFAAHRMHHDPNFAEFILADNRYSAFPEIVEFYAGIDRRRTDAVVRLTQDLRRMNGAFLERTGIPADFNPLKDARWALGDEHLEQLQREVSDGIAGSSLPAEVKDRIADEKYDRAKPYNQALAKFLNESTLVQMIQSMRGAARTLRNSDHVAPAEKGKLLDEVLCCWIRLSQLLVILSPILAEQKVAAFERMHYCLDKGFDKFETFELRWSAILRAIIGNVVNWYQEDVFSRKMGPLLSKHGQSHQGTLAELLVMLVMIRQRPTGWDKEVEHFIVRENKNSFYLMKAFDELRNEIKIGFYTERAGLGLQRLAAMAIAKHSTGVKHPNQKLIEKAKMALNAEKPNEDAPT